jgi:hypothetical protein
MVLPVWWFHPFSNLPGLGLKWQDTSNPTSSGVLTAGRGSRMYSKKQSSRLVWAVQGVDIVRELMRPTVPSPELRSK